MPLILGVTGSIATGKSSLCTHLVEQYGALHADGDRVVHRMYAPGRPAFDRIVEAFGGGVIGADGMIDRRALGGIVFGNAARMKTLTTAIGDIKAEMKRIVDGWRTDLPDDAIAVLEAVNLIEESYSSWCDATWLVGVDDEVALPRLMARNGLSGAEARQRLASARPWAERAPAADRVFLNDGALQDLLNQVDAAITETAALHRAGTLGESQFTRWQRAAEAGGNS